MIWNWVGCSFGSPLLRNGVPPSKTISVLSSDFTSIVTLEKYWRARKKQVTPAVTITSMKVITRIAQRMRRTRQ